MEYFIVINGQQQGPFSLEALRAQNITPDTLVWAQGMPNWVAASQVAELQPLFFAQSQRAQPQQPQPTQPFNQQGPGTGPYHGGQGQQAPSQDPTEMLSKPVDQVAGALDDGGLYRKWMPTVYMVLGVVCCIIPILYLIGVVDGGAFKRGLSTVAAILNIIIALGAGIIGLFYWTNRRNAIKQLISQDAPTLSIVGHFLQSAGECAGLLYYCSSAAITLITSIFTGLDSSGRAGSIIMNGFGVAVNDIITGLVILCLGRFLGEIAKKKSAEPAA